MLNPDQKLSAKLFAPDMAQVATRDGFGDGLVLAGEQTKTCGSLRGFDGINPRPKFAEKFPERFFEIGVANKTWRPSPLVWVFPKIAFISSYASFSPGRNWEQSDDYRV